MAMTKISNSVARSIYTNLENKFEALSVEYTELEEDFTEVKKEYRRIVSEYDVTKSSLDKLNKTCEDLKACLKNEQEKRKEVEKQLSDTKSSTDSLFASYKAEIQKLRLAVKTVANIL